MADEAAEVEKKTAEVVEAKAVDVTGEKQGSKCCGCCCDFRRAVIVMALIGIVGTSLTVILLLVGVGYGSSVAGQATDDDLVAASGAAIAIGSGVAAGVYVVIMLFYVFQLMAAIKYNLCMLYTVLVFELLGLGFDIAYGIAAATTAGDMAVTIVVYILFAALVIYPTAGLIKEIKEGIMSPETYPREAYSCCCMPKV